MLRRKQPSPIPLEQGWYESDKGTLYIINETRYGNPHGIRVNRDHDEKIAVAETHRSIFGRFGKPTVFWVEDLEVEDDEYSPKGGEFRSGTSDKLTKLTEEEGLEKLKKFRQGSLPSTYSAGVA